MPKRVKSDETASRTMSIMPTAAFIRPEKRNATFSDEAICAGLVGAANLKIAAPTGGRGNRPYQKDEYRWAKKRRALTRQKQQKQNASHRIDITVQQLLIRLTDYERLNANRDRVSDLRPSVTFYFFASRASLIRSSRSLVRSASRSGDISPSTMRSSA